MQADSYRCGQEEMDGEGPFRAEKIASVVTVLLFGFDLFCVRVSKPVVSYIIMLRIPGWRHLIHVISSSPLHR
jgi:hypothetical protein